MGIKMTAKLDRSGFNNKLHNLRNLNFMFQQLAGHVAVFIMAQMQDWELNFNPVRRISGDLADKGPRVDLYPYGAVLRMNPSVPYAKAVAKRIEIRYGHNYMGLTWLRIGESVLAAIHEEWHRAVSIIERDGKYTYENPFYTAG